MSRTSRIVFAIVLAAVTVLATGAFAAEGQQPPAPPPGAPPAAGARPEGPRKAFNPDAPAEEMFQNIQAMKGMRAGDLRDSMEFLEGALGVGCGYCHARGGMELDDKPAKKAARRMMTMVQGINRDFFDGKNVVTCFTCHQGQPKPVSVPRFELPTPAADAFVADEAPRPEGPPGTAPAQPAAAPALPSADSVIARFVEAIGGKDAVSKLKGLAITATQADEEHPASVEATWQAPASMVATVRAGEGPRQFVFTHGSDGTNAWGRRGPEPPQDLRGSRRMQALHDAELLPALIFPGSTAKAETEATGKIGDKSVVVLKVESAGSSSRLYFDTASGLLLRRSYEVVTPLGTLPYAVEYADWRAVGGVKLPFAKTSKQPGESETTTITEIKDAGAVDASVFAKPAA